MRSFKVNKRVYGEPRLLGLSLTLFWFFIGSVVFAGFVMVGGFTVTNLFISLTLVLGTYGVLKYFDSDSINRMTDEKFPDIVICDRYKQS